MSTKPHELSEKQKATIMALTKGKMKTEQICDAVGVGKGAGAMMNSLQARGLVRYFGGAGVKPGRGDWGLTELGRALSEQLVGLN